MDSPSPFAMWRISIWDWDGNSSEEERARQSSFNGRLMYIFWYGSLLNRGQWNLDLPPSRCIFAEFWMQWCNDKSWTQNWTPKMYWRPLTAWTNGQGDIDLYSGGQVSSMGEGSIEKVSDRFPHARWDTPANFEANIIHRSLFRISTFFQFISIDPTNLESNFCLQQQVLLPPFEFGTSFIGLDNIQPLVKEPLLFIFDSIPFYQRSLVLMLLQYLLC